MLANFPQFAYPDHLSLILWGNLDMKMKRAIQNYYQSAKAIAVSMHFSSETA